MKNMKKLASLLLALTLLVALAVPAMAAEKTGSITVTNPTAGEVYTLYKLFDLSYGGAGVQDEPEESETSGSNDPHTYSISTSSPWWNFVKAAEGEVPAGAGNAFVTLEQKTGDTTTYYVTWNTGADAAAFAKAAVAFAEANNIQNQGQITAQENATVTFGALSLGYYLIDSSLGALCALDSTNLNANVTEKNQLPTLDKKIAAVEDGTVAEGNKSGTVTVGKTVTFQIDVYIPETAVGEMIVHDRMDGNLTYVGLTADSFAATPREGTETGEGAVVCTKEFVISAAQVADHPNETVTIKYTATLNSDAPIAEAIKNIAHLSYSNYKTQPSEVEVFTYEFDVVKTTSDGTKLDGALFELYDAATEGNVIALVKTGEGAYRVATPEEKAAEGFTSAVIETNNGVATISGLANGTYYLQENEAPEGYNKLKTRQEIVINNANVKANETASVETVDGRANVSVWGGVQVYNFTGAEMPSTGGIGTTIFYIVGGLLIAGAGILLITRKRMNGEEK